MNATDYLIIAGIVLALIWAVRVCIRKRARGQCCSGDCSCCDHSCGK